MSGLTANRRLLACFAASVALHAAATGVVTLRDGLGAPDPVAFDAPSAHKTPPVLGDAVGNAASIDWIGFDSPLRHIAPESLANQAALALNAGERAPSVRPAAPAPEPLDSAAEAASEEQRPPAAAIQLQPREAGDLPAILEDARALAPIFAQLRAAILARALRPLPDSPPVPAEPRVEAPPASSPPAPPAGALADPGAPSDRESPAASREPVADVRLQAGRVVSAAGLEIRTRKPRFETLTRLVANPRNPIVRISFNREGLVANVELLESSTVQAVDDPVVAAVYNWTAAGEPLLKLREGDPDATVDVVIRILLR